MPSKAHPQELGLQQAHIKAHVVSDQHRSLEQGPQLRPEVAEAWRLQQFFVANPGQGDDRSRHPGLRVDETAEALLASVGIPAPEGELDDPIPSRIRSRALAVQKHHGSVPE